VQSHPTYRSIQRIARITERSFSVPQWCTDSLCNLAGRDPCSEALVKETADAMVDQGMVALGYNYVALDDCWSAKTRNATGHLMAEPSQFPSGMRALADYVHARGLYLGLYTCVGKKTCKGDRPGSYGSYALDAATLADWGVDLVKMDHCGLSGVNETDQACPCHATASD
jgi:alpha-galactosidase